MPRKLVSSGPILSLRSVSVAVKGRSVHRCRRDGACRQSAALKSSVMQSPRPAVRRACTFVLEADCARIGAGPLSGNEGAAFGSPPFTIAASLLLAWAFSRLMVPEALAPPTDQPAVRPRGLCPIHSLTYSLWPACPCGSPSPKALDSHASNVSILDAAAGFFFAAETGALTAISKAPPIARANMRMVYPPHFNRPLAQVGWATHQHNDRILRPNSASPKRAQAAGATSVCPRAYGWTRTTSIVLPPAFITSRSASPARTRPASICRLKP